MTFEGVWRAGVAVPAAGAEAAMPFLPAMVRRPVRRGVGRAGTLPLREVRPRLQGEILTVASHLHEAFAAFSKSATTTYKTRVANHE